MDFSYADIQQQFRASLRRFFAAQTTPADPSAAAAAWRGEGWRALAELGVIAALLPEDFGGMGGNATDALAICEEIGRASITIPLIETAIIGAGLINRLGTAAQKAALLPEIAEGRLKIGFADGGFADTGTSAFTLTATGAGQYRLDGGQSFVAESASCDRLLILAGDAVLCLAPDHPGLSVAPFWTLDDRPAGRVHAMGVELGAAQVLGQASGAQDAVTAVLDLAVAAQCAMACGVMASLVNQTVTHLKTRTQFGQPLGNFQALQHRLADMLAAFELALSLTYKAAILCTDPAAPDGPRAVSAAKVETSAAASRIGNEAIQMHGAMGMSLELPIGRAVKILRAMAPQFGGAAWHLRRYRALRGRPAA